MKMDAKMTQRVVVGPVRSNQVVDHRTHEEDLTGHEKRIEGKATCKNKRKA